MIELCAATDVDQDGARTLDRHSTHYRECRRGGAFMMVQGDRPVDSMVFEGPEFSLICRADLPGIRPGSIAARLAALYLHQGDAFVSGLRGAFAIIVYDERVRALKAWTDHFGIERLVFAHSGSRLAVATDLRLLLSLSRTQPGIDCAAIPEYLQYTCIPAPRTIYKEVFKLAPGHQVVSRPGPSVRAFWDMTYDEERVGSRTAAAWAADARDAIRSAVSQNLQDLDSRRLGCFLSGGTDSSSIAGLAGQLAAQPPRTFSIGFDDPRYNEIEYARIAAKRFHADHHEYFVKPDDILAIAQKAAGVYDEPFGNSSIVPTFYCARLAAEHGVTHLLAGDGGDELFGGNARYAQDRVFQRYGRIPRWMRQSFVEPAVQAAAQRLKSPLVRMAASYTRRANVAVPDRYFSYSLVSSMPAGDLFSADFLGVLDGGDPLAAARHHFFAARARNDLNRWMYLDLKIVITDNDLRKVTTMSRLAGITPRYPLLDPRLAEFTGKIPADLKVRGSQLRYLFKRAMQDLLPSEIVTKKKHGFGLPYGVWLAEHRPLRDFTWDVLGSARCRQRGYFRQGLLEWLWSQYESVHRTYYAEMLWLLLMLELWHVTQVDNAPSKADLTLARS